MLASGFTDNTIPNHLQSKTQSLIQILVTTALTKGFWNSIQYSHDQRLVKGQSFSGTIQLTFLKNAKHHPSSRTSQFR